MRHYLIASLILVAVCLSLLIPQASALPVSYNQTALNFGLTSVPRNSSSYDVFPLIPDNWLWEKFDNDTIDSGALSIPSTITYNTNLKALWKFENTTTDSSSSARTLTRTGTNIFTTSGEEGKAAQFNGATWYSATDATLPTGTNPVSISNWINISTFTSNPAWFAYGTGAGTSFRLFFDSSGKLEFNNGSTSTVISTTTFSTSTWYYLTVTYDGTSARVYINGSLDKTIAITVNTSLGGAAGLTIGSWASGTGTIFTGKMDEFRVYSGTALTLQQHQALYMVGHYSQSHTFDGGEYVSLGNVFPFTNTTPFTITSWVKTTQTGELAIIAKGGGGTTGYDLDWINGHIRFRLWDTGDQPIQSSLTYNDGNWHHIAATYDGSGNRLGMKLYIDNILVVTGTSSIIGSFSTTANLLIGAYSPGPSVFLTGQIDNLKIYPYTLSSSQITSDYNSISPISSGKQFMSWYNGVQGSSTLTQKLGSMKSSLSLSCTLPVEMPFLVTNTTNIYYGCHTTNVIHQIDVTSGTDTTYFKIALPTNGHSTTASSYVLFKTIQNIIAFMADPSAAAAKSATKTVNNTLTPTASSFSPVSNQKVGMSGYEIKYNTNSSVISNSGFTTNPCEINYTPTTTEKSLEAIACDGALNAPTIKYWNGMSIQGTANYATNSTQQFLSSIDANSYKKLLSMPCIILVNENPCVTFILTDQTQTDYLIVLTSTHVYYGNAQTALHVLQNNNYALQSYDIITPLTTSAYEIQNPILQGITLYGFNLNTTTTKAGLFTLPSGYTTKTTTINSAIRTIDPRWTNDATDIPIITTTQSLFPIYLTVSNTPAFSAIKVTQGSQIINNMESVYAVAELDSTRSVEVDLVAGTCANVYIADISISPSIWNFQGIICATGVNQKTLAYTNTLPLSFFTLKYGVSESYVPSNNGLVTTFHTQSSPTTYNVLVKNSTGTVAINQTFTVPANQTIDTQSFNVSSVSKPAVLVVNVGGNQIYSSYLGSPLSLANVASFFHQYFNYQGFDFLSFIPIIFAAMFTRNTVSVGMALVVVLMATLSFLSVVTIPDTAIYMAIFIAAIGMVGYRSIYG